MYDEKVWYIIVEGTEEGPYTAWKLLLDERVTLDTLVWKQGFGSWVPLRLVEELEELFEQKEREEAQFEEEGEPIPPQDEIALEWSQEPNFLFLWLLIALIIAAYLIYELSK